MAAYYNEHDPFAAQWLRNLIAAGHIAPGEVDERDIRLVRPDELAGYEQCHFFAGIGGWSLALRLAGIPDDYPVWTGSCPCQPFSAAGKRQGAGDERHLWPAWFRLIEECRPARVFGEQVGAAVGVGWLDDVFLSLEQLQYACGAVDFPACSLGAPHIRQRIYWVADAGGERRQQDGRGAPGDEAADGRARRERGEPDGDHFLGSNGPACGLADAEHAQRRPLDGPGEDERDRHDAGRAQAYGEPGACGEVRELADAEGDGDHGRSEQGRRSFPDRGGVMGDTAERGQPMRGRSPGSGRRVAQSGVADELGDTESERWTGRSHDADRGRRERASGQAGATRDMGDSGRPGSPELRGRRDESARSATSGFWRDAQWLPCLDGKARPVESGSFPLAYGLSARVGRLRAYGNAIVPQQAAEFVAAFMRTT